jgi:nickel-dependent lactate racemase
MKLMDFVKKLGPEVVQKFLVYNHNPYDNCTFLGTTSRGTPVSINSEVMACDLKIAIGAIMPHLTAGFGGGGKSIIPGVAHIGSIVANHQNVAGRGKPTKENPLGKLDPSVGFGKIEGNAIRLDIEEAARMAGLGVIVNAVVNMKRDTVGLFVGDMVAAHREGVKLAEKVYATKRPTKMDIVVANSYAKANEGIVALHNVVNMLDEDCDLVLICNTPEGQIWDYTSRSFGKNIGGRLWGPRKTLPPRIRKMIVLAPYIDLAGVDWLGPLKSVFRANGWPEAVEELIKSHGEGTKVAVIPDATLQYFYEIVEESKARN